MEKNKKLFKKTRGLTLQFMPFNEISNLDSTERIKKLLRIILDNKVVILQGRLEPEEETRLIEDTMIMIGSIKGFRGVELEVISMDSRYQNTFEKLKFGIAKALTRQQNAFTIIGPATIVKEIKKDPRKLEIMMS